MSTNVSKELKNFRNFVSEDLKQLFDKNKRVESFKSEACKTVLKDFDPKDGSVIITGLKKSIELLKKQMSQFALMTRDCPSESKMGFDMVKSTLTNFSYITLNFIYSEFSCDLIADKVTEGATNLLDSVTRLIDWFLAPHNNAEMASVVGLVWAQCDAFLQLPFTASDAVAIAVESANRVISDQHSELEAIKVGEKKEKEEKEACEDRDDDFFFDDDDDNVLTEEELKCRPFVINMGKAMMLYLRTANKIIKQIPTPYTEKVKALLNSFTIKIRASWENHNELCWCIQPEQDVKGAKECAAKECQWLKEVEKLILEIYQESEARLSDTQKTAIDQQFAMTSKISEKFESLFKDLSESFKK